MKWKHIAYLIIVFLIALACEKDNKRIDNFLIKFATVVKPAKQITFQLDNGKTLTPKELKNYSGKNGQRVILNYTPLNDDVVKINSVSDIFTGAIQENSNINTLAKEPVKIQSIWVGGNYLNLILEIEFYEKTHTIGLFRDTQSPTINLHFAHTKNNDPPGYAKKLYASFSLSNIKSVAGSPTTFRVHINTSDGERVFEFEVK